MINKILGVLLITSLVCSPVYAERITLQDGNGNEVGTAGNPLVVSGGGGGSDSGVSETLVANDAHGQMNTNVTAFGDERIISFNGNQYTAFWDNKNSANTYYLSVCQRTYSSTNYNQPWTCTKQDGTGGTSAITDGGTDYHAAIGLGYDADEYIHISYGNHVTQLKYRVSSAPNSLSILGPGIGTNPGMLGTNETETTYPRFIRRPSDGKLFFTFRSGSSGGGKQMFYKFDIGTATATTADSTGDTFTTVAHGLFNGNIVRIQGNSVPTGITETQRYFVVNKTNDTFQVSQTFGGSAVNFSSNGTGVTWKKYAWSAAVGAQGVLIEPASGDGAYIFGPPRWDSDENLHFAWSIRSTPDDINVHYVKWNGTNWFKSDGSSQTTPITEANWEVVYEVPVGEYLSSMNSIDIDANDHPHIVWVEDDANDRGQVYHGYHDGSSWTTPVQISNSFATSWPGANTGEPAMKFPDLARPELAIDRASNIAYIIYRDLTTSQGVIVAESSPGDFSSWNEYLIYDKEVGYWEAAYDRDAWLAEKVLYIPMQVIGAFSRRTSPYSILRWDPSKNGGYPLNHVNRGTMISKGDAEIQSIDGNVYLESGNGHVYAQSTNQKEVATTFHTDIIDATTIMRQKTQEQFANDLAAKIMQIAGTGSLKLFLSWQTPATTETSPTINSAVATYNGTMTASDQVDLGLGFTLDFDGSDDNLSIPDSDDFSFGDGSTDTPVTLFALVQPTDTSTNRGIISRRDATTGSEKVEWLLYFDTGEKLIYRTYDQSVSITTYGQRQSDSGAIWLNGPHLATVTYDGTGGANPLSGTNAVIYKNGVAIASSAVTSGGTYVATENKATPTYIGCFQDTTGSCVNPYVGPMGIVGIIKGKELSADEVWQLWTLIKSYYDL